MRQWTYEEIRDRVEKDLDLQEETFISPEEMLGYANEAIDEAEAEIHGIYEDYFLTKDNIALVSGTQRYDMPSDIYANKIRGVLYSNGSTKYEIKRLKRIKDTNWITSSDSYLRYVIVNDPTDGYQLEMYPTPQETSSTNVTIWYLRNAARLTADDDVLDIPEFANFVIGYMKAKCLAKENMGQVPAGIAAEVEKQRKLMVETLTNMVDDENNELDMDLSFYHDFDSGNDQGGF